MRIQLAYMAQAPNSTIIVTPGKLLLAGNAYSFHSSYSFLPVPAMYLHGVIRARKKSGFMCTGSP